MGLLNGGAGTNLRTKMRSFMKKRRMILNGLRHRNTITEVRSARRLGAYHTTQ